MQRDLDVKESERRAGVGLPESGRLSWLGYVERHKTVVVACDEPLGSEITFTSLHARGSGEAKYRRIFGADGTGASSFSLARGDGRIVCLVGNYFAEHPLRAVLGNVVSIRPDTGDVQTLLSSEEFDRRHRGPSTVRVWCNKILEAADDGTSAIVRVGFLRDRPGSESIREVDYYVARVTFSNLDLEILAPLPHIGY
jgi:hypothetical protein